MNLNKYIAALFGMLLLLPACRTEKDLPEDIPGEEPMKLSASFSRAGEPARDNIYVKAFFEASGAVYFNELRATIPDGLSTTDPHEINFPAASPYYPFGDQVIRIFAYSGKTSANKMTLTAGSGIENDAVLSNYGKRLNDAGAVPGYAPDGTPGNSSDPAEILQFRHVMTQLNVSVEIDQTEIPPIDQGPFSVQFTLPSGVVAQGNYDIRAQETDLATNTSGTYTIQLGTNYLIPTGENLLGKALKTLKIDDYTATSADLAGYTIQALEGQSEMKLLPGYSYDLVLSISRLKLQGLTLSKKDWVPEEVGNTVDYTPSVLTLDLSPYNNTGDDAVTRVILTSSDNKVYTGQMKNNQLEFTALPGWLNIKHVALYTASGLLIETDVAPSNYSPGTRILTLRLSAGGMQTEGNSPSVSASNPYMVTTPVQFMNIEKDLNSFYKQGETIDLNTLNLVSSGRIFNGFGDFGGVYDGNGYRIDGLDIEAVGLFNSVTSSGTLKNVRISTGTVNAVGLGDAGALCGTNSGTIVACINEARLIDLPGNTAAQGGICGVNTATGTVIACVNTGTILGGTTAGGICDTNQNPGAGAIRACINTGMLNPDANDLGFIVGRSVDSSNDVVRTCFALVGSAQHVIGSPEYPVGSGSVGTFDTSSLESEILRNGLEPGATEPDRVVNKLNQEISSTAWSSTYQYVYGNFNGNTVVTGITWPAPVMK